MIFKESQCLQENRLWFSDEHSAMYFIQRMLIPDCLKQVIKTLKIKESDRFFFYTTWQITSNPTVYEISISVCLPISHVQNLQRHQSSCLSSWKDTQQCQICDWQDMNISTTNQDPAQQSIASLLQASFKALAVIMGVKLITSYYRLTCYTQINCTTQKPGPLNQCWALVAHHICSWPLQSLETLISHIHCGEEESGPLSPDALPVQQTRHQKALHTSVHLNSTVSL